MCGNAGWVRWSSCGIVNVRQNESDHFHSLQMSVTGPQWDDHNEGSVELQLVGKMGTSEMEVGSVRSCICWTWSSVNML